MGEKEEKEEEAIFNSETFYYIGISIEVHEQ